MIDIHNMPDWLRFSVDEEDEFLKKQKEKHSREVDEITPTMSEKLRLLHSAKELLKKIEQIDPDVIVFTGRSSILSEALYKATATKNRRIARMSAKVTPYLYGLAEDNNQISQARAALLEDCPDLRVEQKFLSLMIMLVQVPKHINLSLL